MESDTVNIYTKIKKTIIHVIPALIYFTIAFNLINLTQRLMLKDEELTVALPSYLTATLGAIITAKFLLIMNSIPFVNAFPKKPLIYNISWKLFIYSLFSLLFRIVDDLIHYFIKYESSALVWQRMMMKLVSPAFWAIQIWLIMLLFGYVIACEFIRVMGKKTIYGMLFDNNLTFKMNNN